jgi:hypothetical protein
MYMEPDVLHMQGKRFNLNIRIARESSFFNWKQRTIWNALWCFHIKEPDSALKTKYCLVWRLQVSRLVFLLFRTPTGGKKTQQLIDTPTSWALIWEVWAPPKCKFFLWLLLQEKLWTVARLQQRGWENNYFCALYIRNPCARSVWNLVADWSLCEKLRQSGWEH